MLESKQFHQQPFSKTHWQEEVLKIRAAEINRTIFKHSDLKTVLNNKELLLRHKKNSYFLRNFWSVVVFLHSNRHSHEKLGTNFIRLNKLLKSPLNLIMHNFNCLWIKTLLLFLSYIVYLNQLDTKDAVKL